MSGVSRRAALGALALTGVGLGGVGLGGCTGGPDGVPAQSASGSPPPATGDPDVALAAACLADEQAVLDRVAATLRRHPSLTARLRSARVAHQAHVELLAGAAPSGTAGPTPTPAPGVPATPRAALAALVLAEQRLSRLGARRAGAARSGPFARALASMAAAAAQQAATLARRP